MSKQLWVDAYEDLYSKFDREPTEKEVQDAIVGRMEEIERRIDLSREEKVRWSVDDYAGVLDGELLRTW